MDFTDEQLESLPPELLAEIQQQRNNVNISPIKFIKWLLKRLKEYFEQL